ncbi:beta-defensin 115 [Cynocephalus volans]|uniref:beta-defensin 115 n=1 Tax=Cynocephalus volans TaxID=110931 RepID=UPI002FCAD665
MLPGYFSPLSGDIKLLFLTLAVLVVLAQTSPDGWFKRCYYGIGKCRKSCKKNEKKKEKCAEKYVCCIHKSNWKLSHIHTKEKTTLKI